MFKNLLNNLAGNPLERELRRYSEIVEAINLLEPEMEARSDADLRALTEELKDRVYNAVEGMEDPEDIRDAEGVVLNEILPTAFAAVEDAEMPLPSNAVPVSFTTVETPLAVPVVIFSAPPRARTSCVPSEVAVTWLFANVESVMNRPPDSASWSHSRPPACTIVSSAP